MSIETSMHSASNKTPTSVKNFKSTNFIASPSTHSSNKSQISLAKTIDRTSCQNSNSAVYKDYSKQTNVSYINQIDQINSVIVFLNQYKLKNILIYKNYFKIFKLIKKKHIHFESFKKIFLFRDLK